MNEKAHAIYHKNNVLCTLLFALVCSVCLNSWFGKYLKWLELLCYRFKIHLLDYLKLHAMNHVQSSVGF